MTGVPTNPLSIATSVDEIEIYNYGATGKTLLGWNAINDFGEGAVSLLFEADHTELGIAILGANQGDVVFQFFDRAGVSVGTATVTTTVSDSNFTLTSDGAAFAGVTMTNDDGAGITFDDIRLGAGDPPGPPAEPAKPIPTMSAYGLVLTMLGLLLVAGRRLRASAKRS